jgi:hypothetical protein
MDFVERRAAAADREFPAADTEHSEAPVPADFAVAAGEHRDFEAVGPQAHAAELRLLDSAQEQPTERVQPQVRGQVSEFAFSFELRTSPTTHPSTLAIRSEQPVCYLIGFFRQKSWMRQFSPYLQFGRTPSMPN